MYLVLLSAMLYMYMPYISYVVLVPQTYAHAHRPNPRYLKRLANFWYNPKSKGMKLAFSLGSTVANAHHHKPFQNIFVNDYCATNKKGSIH